MKKCRIQIQPVLALKSKAQEARVESWWSTCCAASLDQLPKDPWTCVNRNSLITEDVLALLCF